MGDDLHINKQPNDKVEMEKSYSCIMIFISITRNKLLASRVV
jgi:hypothetical protein